MILLGWLARRLGLATRAEVVTTQQKLRDVRQRLEATAEQLAAATAASARLQQEHQAAATRYEEKVAALAAAHARTTSRASDAAARASTRIAALEEEVQKRDAQLEAAARDAAILEQRVNAALHDLDVARRTLAVVEMKLTMLESAANVLDARLRAGSPDAEVPR